MYEQVLMAGFGGQGVLTCGQILTLAAMKEGIYVTWMPSYGPEVRGGTAYCVVTLADRPIGSPLPEEPSAALIFNRPSLDKFAHRIKSGGLFVLNSSIVQSPVQREDIEISRVPADEIARQAGLARSANIVMLGRYIALSNVVSAGAIEKAIKEYLGASKQHLVEVNLQAFNAGQVMVEELF